MWSLNGVPICIAANDQDWANPISDGNGGAIISWEDERTGGTSRNVYAQRVNATGAVQWTLNGVAIGTASGYKSFSQILPVGSGDGIITWGDERSGSDDRNIFAQRINANGSLTSVRFAEESPSSISLEQNYPNPFNPSTKIEFSIPSVGTLHATSLRVYDVLGREVATLVNENLQAGKYEAIFDAKGLASGVYIYRLTAGTQSISKKLLLTK
ncbi:MAG: T9SS type A sorting domain-containing protein [Ignavibacteriae bacterium]|nr:T9SS type A sorting domain-containing protein [Ignavibacteriota bacterium]